MVRVLYCEPIKLDCKGQSRVYMYVCVIVPLYRDSERAGGGGRRSILFVEVLQFPASLSLSLSECESDLASLVYLFEYLFVSEREREKVHSYVRT